MASFIYTEAAYQIALGTIDFTATGDIRVLLVMNTTTADTEEDATTFGGITTLAEFDGTGYSSPGIALTTEAVTKDTVNNRGEFNADAVTWTALDAGSAPVQAAIVYKFVTNLTSSLPIAFIDTGGFPFTANGSNVTITWNAEGILQFG